MQTYTDGAYWTGAEETSGALTGKETYLVALGTAAGTVKLATSTADAIGVMHSKLEGETSVSVRLLGKGGTVKMRAGGVIAKGASVKWGTGGKVVAASVGEPALGIKMTQGSSADGDVVEVLDFKHTVAELATVATLTGGGASEAVTLTGVTTSMNIQATITDNGANDDLQLLEAKPTADTVTLLFNEDPGAGAKVAIRASL